jgi:hypothetical protein
MSVEFAELSAWLVPAIGVATCVVAYLVGRLFLVGKPKPSNDAAESMMSEFLQGITRDRRGAPRRKGSSVEVHLLLGEGQVPIPGWVLDRSIGGLGVLTDQALPSGAVLKIRPKGVPEDTAWTDVTVRSCRRDGTQYEVGLQFHRTPNWSLMLQFG